ncbi:helix-turn-helix domain-containing protein [Microbacterium sp. NPDC058021]|uniref:helix-turn-helix domain-containing protein n=1 Tax=Microbacterium sp. NPDC058021 TaxID=3346306 RepID=UPI0036DBBD06
MSLDSRAVGVAVRKAREELGLSQDQLARKARAYGLAWTTSRVSELERGERRITLPVLLCVAAALSNEREGYRVSVSDLAGHADIPITDRWSISVGDLSSFISGDFANLDMASTLPNDSRFASTDRPHGVAQASVHRLGFPAPAPPTADNTSTLAERRAARRLGVEASVVNDWAQQIWGQTLDEEAAKRATTGSPQARGHITRQLILELERHLDGSTTDTAE